MRNETCRRNGGGEDVARCSAEREKQTVVGSNQDQMFYTVPMSNKRHRNSQTVNTLIHLCCAVVLHSVRIVHRTLPSPRSFRCPRAILLRWPSFSLLFFIWCIRIGKNAMLCHHTFYLVQNLNRHFCFNSFSFSVFIFNARKHITILFNSSKRCSVLSVAREGDKDDEGETGREIGRKGKCIARERNMAFFLSHENSERAFHLVAQMNTTRKSIK